MTEEQANELATRLTIALIENKQLPFDVQSKRTPDQIAQNIVPCLLAIRDALVASVPPGAHA